MYNINTAWVASVFTAENKPIYPRPYMLLSQEDVPSVFNLMTHLAHAYTITITVLQWTTLLGGLTIAKLWGRHMIFQL